MNALLKTSLEHAGAALSAQDQARLAELIEAAVASWSVSEPFTEAEIRHLQLVAEEPFEEAGPKEVATLFARARG